MQRGHIYVNISFTEVEQYKIGVKLKEIHTK